MMKIDFGSVSGMLCGSMANPMALNYVNDTIPGDNPSMKTKILKPQEKWAVCHNNHEALVSLKSTCSITKTLASAISSLQRLSLIHI